MADLLEKYIAEHPNEFNEFERMMQSADKTVSGWWGFRKIAEWMDKDYYGQKVYPIIVYGPATIFANKIPALDANFIKPSVTYKGGKAEISLKTTDGSDLGSDYNVAFERLPTDVVKPVFTYEVEEGSTTQKDKYANNTAYQLRDTIATWYVSLRNIGVVVLLSVLIYVAIRIILSSTAGETAKYKTMLKDWAVGLCLLFVLHYMMAFLFKATDMIIDMFEDNITTMEIETSNGTVTLEGDAFMNDVRTCAESYEEQKDEDLNDIYRFGYGIIYAVLIFYTLIFTWKYLKRFVYLAFLTMISPLVAVTYPIDKMKDGSAQGFNMWMKEYVYNVLIQPLHLLLYTILITSAQDFARVNLIYTIVAIGFLLEAEKVFKSLFGFNKASGGELSAAVTGGALFGTAAGFTKNMFNRLPGDKNNKKDSGGSAGTSKNSDKIRMDRKADSDKKGINLSTAFGGGTSGSNTATSNTTLNGGTSTSRLPGNTLSGKGRMPVILGSGAASGKYAGTLEKTTGKLGKSINNSKFGQSNIGRKTIRGAKGVGRVAGTGAKKVLTTKNGIRLAKGAASVAGATALGTMGLAAGLASDNPEDAIKYAAVGAGAGALMGSKTVGAVGVGGNAIKNGATGIRDEFEKGAYGKAEAQKRANERADKKWISEVKRHYKDEYGDNWEDAMDNAMELRKRGIVDQDELDKAQKMMDRNPGLNLDQATAIMKESRGLSSEDFKKNRANIFANVMNKTQDINTTKMIMNEMEQNVD